MAWTTRRLPAPRTSRTAPSSLPLTEYRSLVFAPRMQTSIATSPTEGKSYYERHGPMTAPTRTELTTFVSQVDIRLVPMLCILYLISHLDRANIGNAKILGLTDELGLSGMQYNIALSLFFIPYVLLEVPSNILLKHFTRPSVYLGTLIVSWGIIMTLTGVVRNFGGLLTMRLLLGIFEAGFFPGSVYLCSRWYMPRDLATRVAAFFCASALSGAFSGLLAAGLSKMDGVGGYSGWRWIFLIEGLITVVLGVLTFFLLVDSPEISTKWLDQDEIRYLVIQEFIKEGGKFKEEDKKTSWKDVGDMMRNWRIYLLSYIMLCQSACNYGTKFTLPTITEAMGFTGTNAQLMTVPPYIAGAISAVLFSKLSDRYYWRMPFVAAPLLLIVTGYAIIMGLKGRLEANIGPGYFAIIVACMGIYPTYPATASWAMNNLAPSKRRAIGSAFNICMGNTGGIIGSYMYLDKEAPTYPTGFGLSLAFGGSALLVAVLLELSFAYGNKRNARLTETEIREAYTDEQLLAMGDRSPFFKYTL
ncbi:major facilitator superfamily domain-containing protein [Aspergillus minisclerotigenes]|uniref:Major facilitator superfamily domain-containing protein n=1 Tax=Aspergillus minisclerotigenes TaxID=656917 RepID=A0A5N6JJ54_9EURO|nr:major facilitator superfamily domain-containing protein [Aspergillus minisclerotigenes]